MMIVRLLVVLLLCAPSLAFAQSGPPQPASVEAAIADARASMMTDPTAAIAKAKAARDMAAKLPGQSGAVDVATATWLLGEAHVRNGDLAVGGPLIDQALAQIQKVQPGGKLHGDALLSRGNYHAMSAMVGAALADFTAAHEIYRNLGDTRGQAMSLVTIAALYLDANDYSSGLKYVDQALDVYHGDPQLLVSLHNNRGDMLRELHRYAEADAEFRKALALARSLKSDSLALPILRNIARNQLAANDLRGAGNTIAEAFDVLGRGGTADDRAKVLAVAAQLRLQQHRLSEAKALIERAFAGLGPTSDNVQFWQPRTTAYAIYKALGDDGNALAQLEALKRMDDGTAKLAASTNTALMAARFDSANQDLKIAKLQADDAKRQRDFARARQATQFWIFVGAGVTAAAVIGMLGFGLVTIRRSRDQVRAANIDLAETNAALGKALAAKTEFLATTSHEIRTPLNGILGMTQVMLADRRLDEATRDRIGVVHGAGVSMRALVDDILDVAKMETGNLTIECAPVDLPAMLRDVSKMWQDQAAAKGIGFALDLAGAPGRIESDPTRLRQVVFNLLSNAFKFTAQGSIRLTARVVAGESGERVEIAVQDTGIGIPPDKLELIFESFRQADAGTTRQFGGTGLGLAICRNIARAMGGDVTVASTPGQGSTFLLSVPLVPATEAIAAVCGDPGDPCLLIVDRNPITRATLKTLFTARLSHVAVAGSLEDAREAIATSAIGHVLSDEATIATAGSTDAGIAMLAGAPLSLLWTGPDDATRERLEKAGVAQVIARPIAGGALVTQIVTQMQKHDIAVMAA